MSLFESSKKDKNAKRNTNINVMRADHRSANIQMLENERLDVTAEIEQLVRQYSAKSGNKKLRRRAKKVGLGVNDWKQDNLS